MWRLNRYLEKSFQNVFIKHCVSDLCVYELFVLFTICLKLPFAMRASELTHYIDVSNTHMIDAYILDFSSSLFNMFGAPKN